MTIKERIIRYMYHEDWVDKGKICLEMSDLCKCYTDTIGRELRQLTEDGLLIKSGYLGKKGTQYRLAYHEPLKATPKQYPKTLFNINQINNG